MAPLGHEHDNEAALQEDDDDNDKSDAPIMFLSAIAKVISLLICNSSSQSV